MIGKISRVFIFQLFLIANVIAQSSLNLGFKSELSSSLENTAPFWASVNRWGITIPNQNSMLNTINFSSSIDIKKSVQLMFGVENTIVNLGDDAILPELYIGASYKWFKIMGGRKKTQLGENYSPLSLGSMIVSSNALPVPRVSFLIPDYRLIKVKNIPIKIKGGMSHGWLDKGLYLETPLLHEKWLYLSYENEKISTYLGVVNEAIWGGATTEFGPQPDSFKDFLRVFFLSSGPSVATAHEKTNALGNHLGMWDLGFWIKKASHKLHFYLQHPFEDQSGARWLLNYTDGLWGMAIHSKDQEAFFSDIVVELLYTMDQSGSEEVSDSTYGWDDYYNNYLYRGGWVYKRKVIGNPMFTLGKNEIRDWPHIVNNRIIAIHTGFEGNITSSFQYRTLFTYSKNYGTYHDKDRSRKRNIDYFFEDGLNQFSYRLDLKTNQLFNNNNLTTTASIIGDSGELFENTKMFMIGITWNFSTFNPINN